MNQEEPAIPDDAAERDRRLDAVVAAYVQARDAGRPLDRKELLDQNPDLADELTRYFDSDDRVEWLVTAVVPAVTSAGAWFGPYRVVRMISRGGMGVVYEAEDPTAARRVALKVLPTLGLPDPCDQERFRREIELVARLDHPHIVSILDFGSYGGIPYCTMELIGGQDLRTLIRALRPRGRPDGARAEPRPPGGPGLPEGGPWAETPAEYWRFVARVGVQAARALAHAHSQDIWHRDIKPSNLLLDAQGNIHVTDFGLAKAGANPDLTATGDLAGTLRYLAPERLEGVCGPWSDVYSLGLTLYELLVLRPAFESLDRSRLIRAIAREAPRRPRAIDRAIPPDLETIVRRAIDKEPGHRYASAAVLADDLERFLAGRPILGRPVTPWRRAWSWSRRNPRTAGALVAGSLILTAAVGGILFGLLMSRDAAEARAGEAQAHREVAETARGESQYQSLVLQLQQIRLLPHENGWSERAWDLVRQAAAIRADAGLRDQAAATLAGIDARLVRQLEGVGATSVAFDREGKRLLIGGIEPDPKQDGRARILDLTGDRPPVVCGLPGPGPVVFRDDGTPLQLVARPGGGLVLWNLDRRCAVAQFEIPGGATSEGLALRSDGSSVAASVTTADGQGKVLVWDVESCRLRHQFAGKATALAFSDTGELLAAGDEDGRIRVWKLSTGQETAELSQGRNTIHCFSFARSPHRDAAGTQAWLLAAGDSGGSIVVWDLATQHPVSRCHGSAFNVYALAFSPDSTILASTGRGDSTTRLWDWARARTLLVCPSKLSLSSGLAFSHDGMKVATGHHFLRDPLYSRVFVWDLELERGMQTLQGLTAPVEWVVYSPDRRKLAALSHDWRIAVWDLATGRLDAILNAPKGYTADNAGLAFSGDDRQLAASAGREAKLWDLASGKELRSWALPPGLVDRISFPCSDHLLLFRSETLDGANLPIDNDFKIFPRICRVRNLLGPEPLKPLADFRGFNRNVYDAVAVADGRFFLVNGSHDGPDGRYRAIQALDGMTGKEFWSIRSGDQDKTERSPVIIGSLVVVGTEREHVIVRLWDGAKERLGFLDPSTDKELRSLDRQPGSPSPDWTYFVRQVQGRQGVFLHDRDDRLLLNLGIDQKVTRPALFGSDTKRVAWGNADGTVNVADLEGLRARLSRVSLGW
jgi:serine/threonine protein kinase/WD40 repeat protein